MHIDKDTHTTEEKAVSGQADDLRRKILPGSLIRYKTHGKENQQGGVALVIDRGEFPLFAVIPSANPACWPRDVGMLYIQWVQPASDTEHSDLEARLNIWIRMPEMWSDQNGAPYGSPFHCREYPGNETCGWVLERSHGYPGKEVGNIVWEVIGC